MKKVLCTAAGVQQRRDSGMLPAHRRYTGPHIAAAQREADKLGLPLFVLSGAHGFVPADHPTRFSSKPFLADPSFIWGMDAQFGTFCVDEIVFCAPDAPEFRPYEQALRSATAKRRIPFATCQLA